jgi:hypothetical protein
MGNSSPLRQASRLKPTLFSSLSVAVAKASAGKVFEATVTNPNGSPIFLQVYNQATTPTLGSGVTASYSCPANSTQRILLPTPLICSSGIGLGVATTANGGSAPATAPTVSLYFA